ncbi:hypothetical protein GG804_22645 [Sphingomonas histidinilytica]|uniref:Periplasmic heavy metal sensor n=1 Tax=Rhizorhabdus histidinilytica TaxID=439228 RepID=A0A1T5F5G1_9SPHN|nr:hypothetical protein [Rhizorhabdus histidinilytica]MBO9379574.1 hypothetical protein [Rhizorhabdus histidinilytica]SKB91447.1 hypothetical protein SAMN06295920_108168 [Rhizorhabdus histidinilytica]
MMRGTMLVALFLAAPAAAMAAPTPAKPAPAAAAAAAAAGGLSPEGRAIAARVLSPDPRLKEIQAEIMTIRQQKAQIIAGTTVDVETLEPLLRREEALMSELRTRQNDRLLALLRALPDADRIAVLHRAAYPPRLDGAKGAAPATPDR